MVVYYKEQIKECMLNRFFPLQVRPPKDFAIGCIKELEKPEICSINFFINKDYLGTYNVKLTKIL